jgi:hypothetical protein
LKQAVKEFVATCTICQQAKVEHVKIASKLQPLLAWKIVYMDFIEGLPKTHKLDTILVIIDKFTKYGHFIPVAHPFIALQIAQVFMDEVYRLHGLPEYIISDRDRVFTSAVWRELFKLTDTRLLMSSSYHPQSDGQTECLNQCLETSCVVLCTLVLVSGTNGYRSLSIGTIQLIIQLWASLHLRFCMAIILGTLGFLMQLLLMLWIWISG